MYKKAYLTLIVEDIDRSVNFYTEKLGLPLTERHGEFWAAVEAPGVTVGLHPGHREEPGPVASDISLGLMVADLDAAVQELGQRGVEFASVSDAEEQGPRSASFSDPDGYPLYLMAR